jgi:hypothetical protein
MSTYTAPFSLPTASEIARFVNSIGLPGAANRLNESSGLEGYGRTLAALTKSDLSRSYGGIFTSLILRVPRAATIGWGGTQQVKWCFIEVDSQKRGRRQVAYTSVKIDFRLPLWRAQMTTAIRAGLEKLPVRHAENVARIEVRQSAEKSRQNFAEDITRFTQGFPPVYSHQVLKDIDGLPVGISDRFEVLGKTANIVADKLKRIKAILNEK